MLLVVLPLPLVLWLVGAASLHHYGRTRPLPAGRWDAIVVLGAALTANGQPSPALRRRVLRAVALWREGVAEALVFTGGRRRTDGPSEAAAASALAETLGVPSAAIHLEDESTSTRLNAVLTARAVPFRRLVVVTDTFHLYRAARVFRRHADAVAPVASTPVGAAAIRGALREVIALLWYAARGWL